MQFKVCALPDRKNQKARANRKMSSDTFFLRHCPAKTGLHMLCFPQYLCNIDLAVLDIPHFPCMLTGVHQRPPRVKSSKARANRKMSSDTFFLRHCPAKTCLHMLCFPQYLCNIDLAVLDIPHFPCMLTGVHQRPPRASWQCCIFPSNRTKTVPRCNFNKSPAATPKCNIFTRFTSGNVEFLTAQPIRFLHTQFIERRNFPAAPPEPPSNFGFSKDLSTELTSRCCSAGFCSFSRKAHVSKLVFSASFPPRTGQRDAFPQPRFSADLRSATDALAKKHPHALAKPHLFRAAAFFGTIRAGKKTPSGTRGLFPANNRAGKKAPSEMRVLFPGDPKSWQKKIQRWQKTPSPQDCKTGAIK